MVASFNYMIFFYVLLKALARVCTGNRAQGLCQAILSSVGTFRIRSINFCASDTCTTLVSSTNQCGARPGSPQQAYMRMYHIVRTFEGEFFDLAVFIKKHK